MLSSATSLHNTASTSYQPKPPNLALLYLPEWGKSKLAAQQPLCTSGRDGDCTNPEALGISIAVGSETCPAALTVLACCKDRE